ncbi:SDR family oxidoreductase [Hydrogenophaga sp.]|uniref:SDR family oxidoreductase n=1 Tax=Hydrogenophaga sp. TaxID=1904254 RepID=UPI003D0E5234
MKAAESRVLLTGAGGGIGEAVANVLVGSGASVLLAGRSPARLAAQMRGLQQRLPAARVEWHAADLQQASSITALARQASTWNCNVVIHCAGVAEFGRFDEAEPERMAQVLSTNLWAPMVLTQSLLPHLRGLAQAQVICVGSVLGAMGLPGFSVYCASKFGLRGFAQALRRELADTRVLVQYLGPRSTRTKFNSAQVEDYNQATGTRMDAPARVAQELLRMLETRTVERFLGFPEKLGVRVNGLAPVLLDSAFKTHRASLRARPQTSPQTINEAMKHAR